MNASNADSGPIAQRTFSVVVRPGFGPVGLGLDQAARSPGSDHVQGALMPFEDVRVDKRPLIKRIEVWYQMGVASSAAGAFREAEAVDERTCT